MTELVVRPVLLTAGRAIVRDLALRLTRGPSECLEIATRGSDERVLMALAVENLSAAHAGCVVASGAGACLLTELRLVVALLSGSDCQGRGAHIDAGGNGTAIVISTARESLTALEVRWGLLRRTDRVRFRGSVDISFRSRYSIVGGELHQLDDDRLVAAATAFVSPP